MSPLLKAQQAIGAGDLKSARSILHTHLRHRPQDVDGLYLLGICEQAENQNDAAKRLYAQVLAHNPAHFGAHYNLGLLLSNAGQDTEALPHHDEAVRLQPQQFWAYINRGNAKARLGHFESALHDYRHALAIHPNSPEALTNMGNALRETGKLEEALQAHDKAIQLRAQYADAWLNKATTLVALKRPEEALSSVETALELAPASAQAWSTRGAALQAVAKLPEAVASFAEAIRIKPDLADAWLNRGTALSKMRAYQEALDCYEQVLKISPEHAQAWFYRGMTLIDMKSYQDGIQSYEMAMRLDPDLDYLLGAYLQAKMSVCDWDRLEQHLSELVRQIDNGKSAGTPLGVANLLADPALLHKVAALHTAQLHPPRSQPEHLPPRVRNAKIRLGYYSADFRDHPVAQLLVELIERHDRSRFEVVGFSFGPDSSSPLRKRLAHAFDRFLDVGQASDREVVQISRDMGIDIAIDLGGYTEAARTDVFAMRAAPIQASYLGYPGTMGADYIDYLLTDRIVCPEESQIHYKEKLAYLPHCFMPHDSTQEISTKEFTRMEFALPDAGFVFCCFNKHNKITPAVFDVWMRLLKQIPGSVLWLSDGSETGKSNLSREAAARGVDGARIVFARRVDTTADHLARYRLADLFLDTLPYNAHTTACDALWAGVPVLTCMGEAFAGRVAASLLHAINLPELVTGSPAEYEALALDLAREPQRLAALQTRLQANRLTTPLFDTLQQVRNIERLYDAMRERYVAGLAPANLHA